MKKTSKYLTVISAALIITSCKKDEPIPSAGNQTHYTSLADFFDKHKVPTETHTVDATAGGSFISGKGTKVTIPAGAFQTMSGGPVSGTVTIRFRDIYKKSDMLLSDVPSTMMGGQLLKSGGEFFIKAEQAGNPVLLDSAQVLTIEQPVGDAPDPGMDAFVAVPDSAGAIGGGLAWVPTSTNDVSYTATNYIYSLYSFNMPASEGTWCNSDNSSYFSAYPQTNLNINYVGDPEIYTQVYLVFTGINSMVHVYEDWTVPDSYPYAYAPTGLSCTIVAIGYKDGELYSSFTPVTISAGMSVNITLAETDDESLLAQLDALN